MKWELMHFLAYLAYIWHFSCEFSCPLSLHHIYLRLGHFHFIFYILRYLTDL